MPFFHTLPESFRAPPESFRAPPFAPRAPVFFRFRGVPSTLGGPLPALLGGVCPAIHQSPNKALQRTEAGGRLFSVFHVLRRQPPSLSLGPLGDFNLAFATLHDQHFATTAGLVRNAHRTFHIMNISNAIIEMLKHLKDVTQPLTLIAFLAVVLFGLAYLILKAIPDVLKHLRDFEDTRDLYALARYIVSSIFWFSIILLFLGFSAQLALIFHKAERPPSPPNITPTPSPAPVAITTPTPNPNVVSSPTPHPHEYKLVWYNHFDGPQRLWEVRHTDTSLNEVRNDQFKSWCIPFDESKYIIFQRRLIAGNEHFQEAPNWWAAPPYNLPALNERWFQIMDDERWYFYEVQPK